MNLQRIREFVRSEYDHACLRSCRSRALYEGLKVGFFPCVLLGFLNLNSWIKNHLVLCNFVGRCDI